MIIVFNWIPDSDVVAVIVNLGLLFRLASVAIKIKFQL